MEICFLDISKIDDSDLKDFLFILSPSEKKRFDNIKSKKRKKEFLLGRYIAKRELEMILKKHAPTIKINVLKNGALCVNKEKSPFLSISHSKDFVCVAISPIPIGVDIEYKDTKKDINSLANHLFKNDKKSKNFISKFNALSKKEKVNFFYDYWTKKEATFKFDSLVSGLKIPVKRKKIHAISFNKNYSISLCSPYTKREVDFSQILLAKNI